MITGELKSKVDSIWNARNRWHDNRVQCVALLARFENLTRIAPPYPQTCCTNR